MRRGDEKLSWLGQVLPLENASQAEIEALGACTDVATRPAGTLLARQGDIGREAFLVMAGTLKIVRDGRTIAHPGPGELIGELALLGDWHRTADIVAATEVQLLVFDVRSFQRAMHVSEALRRKVEEAVAAHT